MSSFSFNSCRFEVKVINLLSHSNLLLEDLVELKFHKISKVERELIPIRLLIDLTMAV